ncbi:MAG: C1 family peptidase [Terriglobales bacterium]|jgi:C1A family cysteine protease
MKHVKAVMMSILILVGMVACSSATKENNEPRHPSRASASKEVRSKNAAATGTTGLSIPEDLEEQVSATNALTATLLKKAEKTAPPTVKAVINHPSFCTGTEKKMDFTSLGLVTPVKDQNVDSSGKPVLCGSCWAFASNAVLESSYLALRKENVSASEQELVSCSSAGTCARGGWWAFGFLQKQGIESESNYPYEGQDSLCKSPLNTEFRILPTDYLIQDAKQVRTAVPSDTDLKQALCAHGPLAVAFRATTNFTSFGDAHHDSSVFEENDPGPINHALVIVGWDETGPSPAWIVKNSWGQEWGEKGFVRIRYGTNHIGQGAAWAEAWPKDYSPAPSVRAAFVQSKKHSKSKK